MKTKHLTIMFTDIKGFTPKTSRMSRKELQILLEKHDELIKPIFEDFNGTIVKTIGDAFMVTFHSPTNAVLCGMKIQKELKKHNEKSVEGDKLEIRVAVNSGEVTLKEEDVFGEAVNIAARLEGIADAGDIYFTEAVYLAMNKSEIPTAEIGYKQFKGIPEEIKVYKVLGEGKHRRRGEKQVIREKKKRKEKIMNVFAWIGIIVVSLIIIKRFGPLLVPLGLFVGIGYWFIQRRKKKKKSKN
jgi:class 3 adenylate cyclase